MFTPFFTKKEIGKGTGLGLSISRNIIIKNGGVFEYNNQENNTSFTIKLLNWTISMVIS